MPLLFLLKGEKAMDFKSLMNGFKDGVNKHSPEILIGIGVAGMITSTILAVKATPKAMQLIKDAEFEKADEIPKCELCHRVCYEDLQKTLTTSEVIKAAWKPYIPAVAIAACSVTCIISGTYVNGKRNVALATAYKLTEQTLSQYRSKVIETIGEKKDKEIMGKVHKERMEKKPVSKADVIMTGNGDTLCFDINTGQYFESNIDRIRGTVNELNRRMLSEMYISWNDFLYEIGEKTIPNGDDLGWNVNDEGFIELDFGAQLTDENKPCIAMEYRVAPRYDYSKLG